MFLVSWWAAPFLELRFGLLCVQLFASGSAAHVRLAASQPASQRDSSSARWLRFGGNWAELALTESVPTASKTPELNIVAVGVWDGRFDRVCFHVCVFNALLSRKSRKGKMMEWIRETELRSFVREHWRLWHHDCVKWLSFLFARPRRYWCADAVRNRFRGRTAFSLFV